MKNIFRFITWRALGYLLMTVLICIVLIITTHRGNLLLISAIEKRMPELHVSLVHGSLLFSPHFSTLEYSDADVSITINEVQLNWHMRCLWQSKLCIDTLTASELIITQKPPSKQFDSKATTHELSTVNKITTDVLPFDLGLEISVDSLNVNTLSIEMNELRITLDNVDTSMALAGNNLVTKHLNISSINIYDSHLPAQQKTENLPASEGSNTESDLKDAIAKLQQSLMQMHSVMPDMPLNLTLQQSEITALNYHFKQNKLPDEIISFNHISAKFVQHNQLITSLLLNSEYQNNTFNLNGSLTLDSVLSHQLALSADINNDFIGNNTIELTTKGDINRLALTGHVNGDIKSSITGELSLVQPNIPFNITASWLPMTMKHMALDLGAGNIRLKGDLSDYAMELSGIILPNEYPEIAGDVTAQGSMNQLTIEDSTFNILQGDISFEGTLSWESGLVIDSKIAMNKVLPHDFWPQYQGELSGNLDVNASLSDTQETNNWHVKLANIDISGLWMNRKLDLSGHISGQQSQSTWGQWFVDDLSLQHGRNNLSINGSIAQNSNLTADISVNDIGMTLPSLSSSKPGKIQGKLTLEGPIEKLQLDALMSLNNIDLSESNLSLERGTIVASAQLSKNLPFNIDVSAQQILAPGLNIDDGPNRLTLSLSGNKAHHLLTTSLTSRDLNINTSLSGELTPSTWRATIKDAVINAKQQHLALSSPLTILADLNAKSLVFGEHCWLSTITQQALSGTLCLASPFSIDTQLIRSNEAVLNLEQFSMAQFQPYFPPEHVITGDLSGHLSFQLFSQDKLNLSSKIQLNNGLIVSDFGDSMVSHKIEKFSVNAAIDRSLANFIAHLSSPTLGVIDVSMVSNIFDEQPFVSGHIKSHGLELSPYRPFLKYVSLLDGELSVSAGFSGDFNHQQIFGQLTSNNITVASDKLPSRIDNLNAQMSFTGSGASLDSAFSLAKGNGALKGSLDWGKDLLAQLTLTGNALALSPSKGIDVVFSPDLTLTLSAEKAKIRGDVNIDSAHIKIDSLPQSAVGLSEDVVIKQQINKKHTIPLDIDVNTLLGDQLYVDAFGLKSKVEGALNIIQTNSEPLGTYGELALKEAQYKAFGQQLTIEQGQIIFTGSATNPVVNIKATRNPKDTNDNVIAGVYVNGAVDKPALTVFTVPAMEQQESLSYLIYGYKSGAGGEAFGQNMAISMLVNGGLGGASKLIGNLGSAVGIDNFNVTTTGSGDATRVEFSGSIGPNLQLRYGVGVFDALPEVGLRYQINQRLFIDFINNTNQALDLLYKFSFD